MPTEDAPAPACADCGKYLIAKGVHAERPNDPLLGEVLADKYPIIDVLGVGGMGTVYRALQLPINREVAVKVLKPAVDSRLSVEQRFRSEAETVARLRHPNTVTLHDYGVHTDGTLYMVMELVEGKPLSHAIRRKPMSPARAGWIVWETLQSLVEAHGVGLVHRDLKPDNIMLVDNAWGSQSVKVLDFGLARVFGQGDSPEDRLTGTGVAVGTSHYMSPEQVVDRDIDARSDQYALGAVLYEALTGRPPFDGPSSFEILMAHRTEKPPPFDAALGIPDALGAVALTALKKRPENRYADAADMARALAEAIDFDGPSQRVSSPAAEAITAVEEAPPDGSDAFTPVPDPTPMPEMSGESISTLDSGLLLELRDAVDDDVQSSAGGAQGRPWALMGGAVAAAAAVAFLVWASAEPPPEPAPPRQASAAAPAAAPAPPETPGVRARRLLTEGARHRSAGRAAEALVALTGATTSDPKLADAQYALASLYASKGDATLARAHLEKYVTLAGDPAGVAARVAGEADFAPVRDDDGFRAWAATLEPPAAAPPPSAKARTKRKRKAKARAPRKRPAPAPEDKGAAVTVPDF